MKIVAYYCRLIFLDVPKLAQVLSGGSWVKLIALLLSFEYFLLSRKTFLKGKSKYFTFYYNDKKFGLTLFSAVDIAALIEVFILLEYKWSLEVSPNNILDLGAHWGDTAIYYAIEYPQAKIFSLEPSPSVFERLKEQTGQFQNIFPIQGALGLERGEIDFYISESSLGNSVVERSSSDKKISVQSFSLDNICEVTGVDRFDLIKFDIEGAERFIFADESIKSKTNAFIGEIHLDLMPVSLREIEAYFLGFNLELQKINDHRYILKATKQ